MRNTILMFAVLIMIVSCNKDKNSNGAGIQIKGRISQIMRKSAVSLSPVEFNGTGHQPMAESRNDGYVIAFDKLRIK